MALGSLRVALTHSCQVSCEHPGGSVPPGAAKAKLDPPHSLSKLSAEEGPYQAAAGKGDPNAPHPPGGQNRGVMVS